MRAPIALSILLFASSARADPEPVRFAWVRAEGAEACATQPKIAEQVAARLGASPFSERAARSVDVLVSREPRGFRAVIHVRDAEGRAAGSREISSEAEDCGALEAASVLAIAIAVDPEALTRPPPASTPAPVAAAVPVPAPVYLRPPPVAPPPMASPPIVERPRGLGGSGVALRGGVGLGLLPQIVPAVSLAGYVALGTRVQLAGEATWIPEARTNDRRFGFGLAALSLGACVTAARFAAADLAACGAVWAGALHAVVYDLTPAAPGDYAWAGVSVTPRLRVKVGPAVHVELGTHVIAPIVRRVFAVRGWAEPVFQEAPVTAIAFGGLGANFL